MRILVAAPLYPPELGGPATYARLIEEALPKQGIEVTVVPFSSVRKRSGLTRHLAYLRQLVSKGKGAKAIYALDSISVGLPAYIVSKLLRVPLVVRIGGLGSWERATEAHVRVGSPHEFVHHINALPSELRLMYRLERFVLRSARHVVVPSKYLKNVLIGLGAASDRITVIYNGMEPVAIRHVGKERALIVSAGRLVELKCFDVLISAMGIVRKTIRDARLELYGDGPSHARLERHIAQQGLGEAVRLLPALSRDELLARIARAQTFVLPSMHETFSNLIVETMAVGTPVVATSVGGTPEIVNDGVNGLLVPPTDAEALADAIISILEHADLAQRLAEQATKTLERFGIARVIDESARVLREAVQ